jgi:tetratricopeptide (TPR) repeat protein
VIAGIRISAALIVRDEEEFLAGCLGSLVGHVDEIVLVDTGSTDRTVEIARSFDVKLLEREWRDDFAWARNEGLDAATGDWILYIDADERLTVPDGANLRDNLAGDEVFASRLLFRPTLNATPFREYRLFRNDPRLRFRGSMHETIIPDLVALKQSIGARVTDSPVELLHLGYERGSEWKHERNLPLLRAAIAEDPDRLYYWYHLAETLVALDQVEEALAVGAEGLRRAQEGNRKASDSAIAALLAITHARLLHLRGEDAMPTIALGRAQYPRNPSLQLLEARILLDRGRPEAALPILQSIAATDSATYSDPRLSHDRRLFDVYAPDLMGVALLRLGRRAEAAEAFWRAAAAAPEDMSYRIKAQALGPRAA